MKKPDKETIKNVLAGILLKRFRTLLDSHLVFLLVLLIFTN